MARFGMLARAESQRDVLPAVDPQAADVILAAGDGETAKGVTPQNRLPLLGLSSASRAQTSASGAPASHHRRAGSFAADTVTTSTSAESRMNLLLAARENMSQKNLGIDVAPTTGGGGSAGVVSAAGGADAGAAAAVRGRGVSRFAQLVMKVQEMNEESSQDGGSRASGSRRSGSRLGGTGLGGGSISARTSTTAGDGETSGHAPAQLLNQPNQFESNTERLFQNVALLEQVIEEEEEDLAEEENTSLVNGIPPPPPPPPPGMSPGTADNGVDIQYQSYQNVDEEAPLVGHAIAAGKAGTQSRTGLLARCMGCLKSPTMARKPTHSAIMDALRPRIALAHTLRFLRTTFAFGIVPCFGIAYVLFHYCGNPTLPFLPGDSALSWWLLFITRQLLTLQLAFATEYVLVEAIACRSPVAIKLFGPLMTLFAMQAKGWPFLMASWATWDLLLLHGGHAFAKNWLFYLDIPMLSEANGDDGFLESEIYLRSLLAAIFAGIMTAIKRTYLALYMGRRTFDHYKPQLEQLMINIVLIAHIADLASETETPEFAEALALCEESTVPLSQRGRGRESIRKSEKKWSDIKFEQKDKKKAPIDDSSEEGSVAGPVEESEDEGDGQTKKMKWNKMLDGQSVTSDDAPRREPLIRGDMSPGRGAVDSSGDIDVANGSPPMRTISAKHMGDGPHFPQPGYQRQTSSNIKMKNLLDRWDEPVNKMDKAVPPSIHDILQFRKALSYLDDSHPFSESFGPSETRDQCIKSSQKVFKRLLNFVPGEAVLPFDVIGSIAMDEDGIYDRDVSLALVRLFRPNRDDCLTMLNFVQSCDWMYKKVRYLRASVANSTLIDRVLEHDFNILFYFFLVLIVISILNFDPWSLLFSMSTILVSFAFALGPSAAKAIEGVFLIAMQRPFDLGDRVCITSATGPEPDLSQNWFVEDVSLWKTTLRYAATNEVSTVNNGSIAGSRIINFARSQKALCTLNLMFRSEATNQQISLFRAAVEKYVKDNPRVWSSMVAFFIVKIDPDAESTEYLLRFQHQKSWQEISTILLNRGELLQFCLTLMLKLDIAYDSPKSRISVELNASKRAGDDEGSQLLQMVPSFLRGSARSTSSGLARSTSEPASPRPSPREKSS